MSALVDRVPVRIGGFVVLLAVLFGSAFGVGRVVADDAVETPGDEASYALRLEVGTVSADAADAADPVRFTIVDQDDRAVTRFDVRHEKRLHLIAVRDDFGGFQHVHPTMAADGTWSADLDLVGGGYRLFADFQEEGADQTVAHADLAVAASPGSAFAPSPPRASRTTTVDGYDVALSGDLAAGAASTLTLTVSRDGEPVADLEPYLGAYGHLVVLRGTDKQYLHTHPEDGPAGPEIAFGVEVPTVGRYYLYLDFQHRGKVRTASFALDASDTVAGSEDGEHDGGH